nr:MFS transporter [Streptomyces sp. MA3_2.13]
MLINRDYTLLWIGQAVSSVGAAVFSTTLVLWVATDLAAGEPWAPMAVSGVLMATSIAVLGIGPLAGVFVDRWDKRATMLRTEVVRGLLVGTLAIVSILPTRTLPVAVWLGLVYLTVLLLHTAAQFFTPARFAIIADLVTGDADRARAAGITQATSQTAWIIGPPLAAPLLFTAGVQWSLFFNAAAYLVSFLAIRAVRSPTPEPAPEPTPEPVPEPAPDSVDPAPERKGVWREFVAGLRFFARSRFLVALVILASIGQFGVGALETLNVFFVTETLDASAKLYGYIGMAMGIGGITGALCAGRVVQWFGARRTTWIALLVSGALLMVYSRQTGFLGGVVVLFLFTVPLTMLNTAMAPLLLGAAPSAYRGRVLAVFYPVTRMAAMLAAVLSGWLAGTVLRDLDATLLGIDFGATDTIFTVSGLIVMASGVYARFALPDPDTPEGKPVDPPDPVEHADPVERAEPAPASERTPASERPAP